MNENDVNSNSLDLKAISSNYKLFCLLLLFLDCCSIYFLSDADRVLYMLVRINKNHKSKLSHGIYLFLSRFLHFYFRFLRSLPKNLHQIQYHNTTITTMLKDKSKHKFGNSRITKVRFGKTKRIKG